MATPLIGTDISIIGDKELERRLKRMAEKDQRSVVRSALRKEAERLKTFVVRKLSGFPVAPRTGRLLTAMAGQKPRLITKAKGLIGYGLALPARSDLGIGGDEEYYPAILEYGHGTVPAKSYLRAAVDDNATAELRRIGADIGKGIERKARKKA